MTASWSQVLDLYGRALLDFDHEIEAGRAATAVFDFELPPDLGPLPAELAVVAANVDQLSSSVQEHVRQAMHETARDRALVTRARSQANRDRPRARIVDVNG